jgi:hypothetical protein
VEENKEGKGFEQGRLRVCFWEERETTEDLEKRLQGLKEKKLPFL